MKEIVIATKNKGKAGEFRAFFKKLGITAKSLLDFDEELPDVEETGTTFEENAALKAEQMSVLLGIPVLADDSGLVVDALGGKPGVYSARYAHEQATDEENVLKLLKTMQGVPLEKRSGRFVSVLAIARPNEETIFAEGICEGAIGYSKQGIQGFGYDPIFIPKGYLVTMACLPLVEKNRISHRKHALDVLERMRTI